MDETELILWTFTSTDPLLPNWYSWECMAGSEALLIDLCIAKYGRVCRFTKPCRVTPSMIPDQYKEKLYNAVR